MALLTICVIAGLVVSGSTETPSGQGAHWRKLGVKTWMGRGHDASRPASHPVLAAAQCLPAKLLRSSWCMHLQVVLQPLASLPSTCCRRVQRSVLGSLSPQGYTNAAAYLVSIQQMHYQHVIYRLRTTADGIKRSVLDDADCFSRGLGAQICNRLPPHSQCQTARSRQTPCAILNSNFSGQDHHVRWLRLILLHSFD